MTNVDQPQRLLNRKQRPTHVQAWKWTASSRSSKPLTFKIRANEAFVLSFAARLNAIVTSEAQGAQSPRTSRSARASTVSGRPERRPAYPILFIVDLSKSSFAAGCMSGFKIHNFFVFPANVHLWRTMLRSVDMETLIKDKPSKLDRFEAAFPASSPGKLWRN